MFVSVVIPTYKRPQLTARAVQSAIDQEWSHPFEVIVADDGSEDDTRAAIEALLNEHRHRQNVKWIEFPRSGDAGVNRNRAVQRAKGDWIAFLDSDDRWKPGCVGAVMPGLSNADFVYATESPSFNASPSVKSWIQGNRAMTSSVWIRRSLFERVGGFRAGDAVAQKNTRWDRGFEDYDLWLRVIFSLYRDGKLDRVHEMSAEWISIEPQSGGLGRMTPKEQVWREWNTLRRYWRLFPIALKLYFALRTLKVFLRTQVR